MGSSDDFVACIDTRLLARAAKTVTELNHRGLSLVTAESCTAGLIAAALSQAKGAGTVLHGSFVAYSKDHKAKTLDVDLALLRDRGAVNEDVLRQMLAGALEHSVADLALAVTGVLGPEPDEDGNPVGLVFLGSQRRGGEPRCARHDYGDQSADLLRRHVVVDGLVLLESII